MEYEQLDDYISSTGPDTTKSNRTYYDDENPIREIVKPIHPPMQFSAALYVSFSALSVLTFANAAQEPLYQAEFSDEQAPGLPTMTGIRPLNKTLFNPTLYKRVREVWFGDLQWGAKVVNQSATDRWFPRSEENKVRFDKVCRDEFHPAVDSISPAKLSIKGLPDAEIAGPFLSEIEEAGDVGGLERAKTALSLMVLLDQIPRNLFRTNETLKMVYEHYDRIAVSLARHITTTTPRLDLHPSLRLSQPYRQWFYLPLMHSEDLADHRLFSQILAEFKAEAKGDKEILEAIERTSSFEGIHVEILERFGRYPHRHDCLGREYTEEERKWLDEGGQRFGVAG